MATRKYEQRLRAEAAEETRRRILDAVHQRLREEPGKPVSVDHVARSAGVSRSTVYLIFGSRSGLFQALAEDMLERGGWARVARAIADPDPREHLRGALSAGAGMLVDDRDVWRALRSMAAMDEDGVGDAFERLEKRRARGMAVLARRLDKAGLLRADMTVEEATDVLFVLSGFDAFDLLYTGRRLSAEKVAARLVEIAERSLLR